MSVRAVNVSVRNAGCLSLKANVEVESWKMCESELPKEKVRISNSVKSCPCESMCPHV